MSSLWRALAAMGMMALMIFGPVVPGQAGSIMEESEAVAGEESREAPAEAVEVQLPPVPVVPSFEGETLPAVFRRSAPESLEDLRSFEGHVRDMLERVSAPLVSVRVGSSTGSGVVISEDGLVLTVAHVSAEPGRNVTFTFPDGRRARGTTLGTNHRIDSSLMKISDEGPWPFAQPADLGQARLGDWVLALGHPGGFDPGRSYVVRLGRLIRISPGVLQTDCTLSAGDSGGPLFDMHGRVIGIHSRIGHSTAGNFHVPIDTYLETWDRLAQSENWGREAPVPESYAGVVIVDDPEGCRLEALDETGPAFKAGLRAGDILLRFNGEEVRSARGFRALVARTPPGEEVLIDFKREGEELAATLTIERRQGRGR